MAKRKPCPFCGGAVRLIQINDTYEWRYSEVQCDVCGMLFTYRQDFAYSFSARVALNESFDDIWNRRVGDTDGKERSE